MELLLCSHTLGNMDDWSIWLWIVSYFEYMDVKTQKGQYRFKRYELGELNSIASLVKPKSCGIYILEFANGDKYVGQSVNQTQRFASHAHGSSHHEGWGEEIVAYSFLKTPQKL